MTNSDHVLSMIRFRFVQTGLMQGLTPGEANLMAEQVMKNQGLFGLMGKMKILATPEGSISTIVETFLKTWKQNLSESKLLLAMSKDDPLWEPLRVKLCEEAVESVEAHRNRFCSGTPDYPRYIYDYVVYRISLEVRQIHGIDASEMGLTNEIVRTMSEQSYKFHLPRVKGM